LLDQEESSFLGYPGKTHCSELFIFFGENYVHPLLHCGPWLPPGEAPGHLCRQSCSSPVWQWAIQAPFYQLLPKEKSDLFNPRPLFRRSLSRRSLCAVPRVLSAPSSSLVIFSHCGGREVRV